MTDHGEQGDDALSAALASLERHWSADSALLERLQPGLPSAHIAATLAAAGIDECPTAVLDWFGWHDGTDSTDIHASAAGPTRWSLLAIDSAVDRYRFLLSEAERYARLDGGTPADRGWSSTWFPVLINGSGDTLAIDCATERAPGPLHMVFSSSEVIPDVAPSLLSMVRLWCRLHESGAYAFVDGAWTVDWDSEEFARFRWTA